MVLSQAAFLPKNRPYDAAHYHIHCKLDVAAGRFYNIVHIRLTPLEAISQIELDSVGLDIREVTLAPKKALKFQVDKERNLLTIDLAQPAPKGRSLEISIEYSGQANVGHEGLFRTMDPDEPARLPLYFTHFESISARRFFPSNDEPYDKATTEMTVEVDPKYRVLSNGRLISDQVSGSGSSALRRSHWILEKPHSTYLVNLAAGDFVTLEDKAGNVPIEVHTSAKKKERARFSAEVLKKAFRYLEDFYGIPYPWPRYAMVGVPGFLWGGMENTGLTSMRESAMVLEHSSSEVQKLRIASVVAHELAHQWFGDYVTMKWWDDLWLNEAFASYMETVACQDYFQNEWAVIETVTGAWENYFREEDGPRSHPIVSKELPTPDDAFDSTNYTKGEQVLRMLDFYIGREAFRKGLKDYLSRHALGNATYQDFMGAMEKASGENLQGFVASWLLARGYPVLTIQENWDEAAKTMRLEVRQASNHAGENTIFDFKIPVDWRRVSAPAYHERRVFKISEPNMVFEMKLPAKPDWTAWNAGGAALVRIERQVDEKEWSLQALQDPDPLARISALFELAKPWWDRGTKTLRPLSGAAIKTLETSLGSDPSPYVRVALLSKLLDSKWPRFPGNNLAPVLLAQARRPSGLPASDAIGFMLVQSRSLALLGKVGGADERSYAVSILTDRQAGLDLAAGAASAVARFSDAASAQDLRSGLEVQETRGYPFAKAILLAFGSIQNPSVVSELEGIVQGPLANNEIVGGLLYRLSDNETVKTSAEGTNFIRDFVLRPNTFNEEMKSRALGVLDEVKAPPAKSALEDIAAKSSSQRLRELAKKTLAKNFSQD